ncbi:MAG TPA: hypothetical protein VL171_15710 [Verrucomicrobiae bacterium]|nr:hypothetical protein [Verrucomicrobiae bacterium]
MIPGFGLLAMLACAVFYYRLGEQEHSSGILLAALSLGLWLAAGYLLPFGLLGCILVQVGLFAVLWVWNVVKEGIKK